MQIEAIHERAIELLVSGSRQVDIAADLNIGVRTLRRWACSEKFMTELRAQRECAQHLQAEQRALAARLERQVFEEGARKMCQLINDPNTSDNVRIQCLRISQQVLARAQAQEWREFVYFDTIAREKAKEDEKQRRIEDRIKAQREQFEAIQNQYKPKPQPQTRPTAPVAAPAAKSPTAATQPATPDKVAQPAAATTPTPTPTPTPTKSAPEASPAPRRIHVDPVAVADQLVAEMEAIKDHFENRPKAATTGHDTRAST